MTERGTDWRQGDVLTEKDARSLNLIAVGSNSHAVVISHDCDLSHPKEYFFEVIVGKAVSEIDATLANARNPRRLHLEYDLKSGGKLRLELTHADRKQAEKKHLSAIKKDDAVILLPQEKRILKQWLAARYGRPAFPDSFEQKLRKKVDGITVEKHIEKILKPASPHLVGVFLDLGLDRAAELDGLPYSLSIHVVYNAIEGGPDARKVAEEAASKLSSLFLEAYGDPANTTEIAVETCDAIADTHMTLADLRKIDQWRLEHISLSEGISGDFLAVGEIPS